MFTGEKLTAVARAMRREERRLRAGRNDDNPLDKRPPAVRRRRRARVRAEQLRADLAELAEARRS